MTTDLLIPQRVERCEAAITGYSDDSSFISLIDLLADARHWCDANDQDYADLDRIAVPALPRRTQRRTNRRKETSMTTTTLSINPFYAARRSRPYPPAGTSQQSRSMPGCHSPRGTHPRCRT